MKSLYDKNGKYTDEAWLITRIAKESGITLAFNFNRAEAGGYSLREASHIIMSAVFDEEISRSL
jgi:hypothetical protein